MEGCDADDEEGESGDEGQDEDGEAEDVRVGVAGEDEGVDQVGGHCRHGGGVLLFGEDWYVK